MVSVIIAAHNEEAVIARCLEAVLAQDGLAAQDVVVSANGCSDRTAHVAAGFGVRVIDRAEPGKAAALNAADAVATSFPRVYLDADILMPTGALARLTEPLSARRGVHAVVPRRRLDTTQSTWPVRAYSAISERLPVFTAGLFGRGMITVSEEGRKRFDAFPTVIADDLFLDAQFRDDERAVATDVQVVVEAPRTTRDLLARLVRVRRGNTQLRAAAGQAGVPNTVRRSDRWSWLRDVVLPHPWLFTAGVVYVLITLAAGVKARRGADSLVWGRDESTRRSAAEGA